MTAPGYAELGARSNFSFLEGASHPQELVTTAHALGHAAIGVADRNSVAGLVRAHVAAREAGLPFVPGMRLCLPDGTEYLAWPTDRAAWGRLTRLLSTGRMGAPRECRIDRDGVLAAARGSVLALVAPDAPDAAFAERLRADAAALRGVLARPLFCAVAHRFAGDDAKRLDLLAAMAGAAGARLIAAGGVLMHAPARRRLADMVAAIRLRTTIDALGLRAHANAEAHLKSPAEMARLFARHPDALAATLEVQRACTFGLDQLRYEYPEELLDPGRTPQQTLEHRTWEAAAAQWPWGVPPKIVDRLREELGLIAERGYAANFLTVHEICRFARSKGILHQGRGSAANSAVCYALGITAVNPEEHDLLFARFISTAREEPPDIDVDFEHERREEVIQWLYARYGRDRAAIAATVVRYRTRSAVREVGRALGLSDDVTAQLARGSWPAGERTLEELAREGGMDPLADARLRATLELADALQEFPRHLATHVGGFVVTRGPLVELCVVTHAAMQGRTTIEWDKDDIDALGLLKVDVLGLGMLTCLHRAYDLLGKHRELVMGLRDTPRDDPATYAMLCRGDSLGVFQVESRAQMNMLPRLRPAGLYDLVIEVAIVRPGPIQGDMVHPYLRRRAGLEPVEYPSPAPEHGPPDEMRSVLGKTLGVPLFQEQAMRIAIVAAKFDANEADALRRAMATFKHGGDLPRFREKFIGGMVRRGYPQGFAERCFGQIEGFGTYGFPESHAASFALLVYASAWIKCHHPEVFAAALLNSQPMGFYAPAQIVRDAQEHGVEVRPIDVNHSDWDSSLEDAASGPLPLRLGLRLAAGLPKEDGQRVADARRAGGPFASVADVARRAGLGRRAMDALAEADAFAALAGDRRAGMWEAAGVQPALALDGEIAEATADLPAATAGEETVLDYLSTGLTLRHHPLALLRPQLEAEGLADTRRLNAARQGAWLRLPGLVLVRQRPGSAKGVIFFTVEDEWGVANLVVYTDVAERHRAAVVAARLLIAEGRVERHEASAVPIVHLICRRLEDRSAMLAGLHGLDVPDDPAWKRTLAHADEVQRGVTYTAGTPRLRLPASRDFH